MVLRDVQFNLRYPLKLDVAETEGLSSHIKVCKKNVQYVFSLKLPHRSIVLRTFATPKLFIFLKKETSKGGQNVF